MRLKRFTRSIKKKQSYCEFELKDSRYQDLFNFNEYREIENEVDCNLTLAIDKLGQLEDIEKELGISLIVLFNALKHGIKPISDWRLSNKETPNVLLGLTDKGLSLICPIGFVSYVAIDTKAYNKAWVAAKGKAS